MRTALLQAKQLAITRRQPICVLPVAAPVNGYQFRQNNCAGAVVPLQFTPGALAGGTFRLQNNVTVAALAGPPVFTPLGAAAPRTVPGDRPERRCPYHHGLGGRSRHLPLEPRAKEGRRPGLRPSLNPVSSETPPQTPVSIPCLSSAGRPRKPLGMSSLWPGTCDAFPSSESLGLMAATHRTNRADGRPAGTWGRGSSGRPHPPLRVENP